MKHRIQDQRTLDRRICVDLGPASPFEGSWMTPGSDCLRVEPQCQLPTFHQSPVVLRPVANLISEGVVAFAPPLAYQGGERWGWSQISATTPQTVFGSLFGGDEVVVILELDRENRSKARYEYKLLATNRTSTMQRELQEAGEAGFKFVGVTVSKTRFGGREVVSILLKEVME